MIQVPTLKSDAFKKKKAFLSVVIEAAFYLRETSNEIFPKSSGTTTRGV